MKSRRLAFQAENESEPCIMPDRMPHPTTTCIHVIGLNGSASRLPTYLRALVAQADLLVGGRRHLADVENMHAKRLVIGNNIPQVVLGSASLCSRRATRFATALAQPCAASSPLTRFVFIPRPPLFNWRSPPCANLGTMQPCSAPTPARWLTWWHAR